jgi:RNA polymerase-binding transcription factor DksA
MFHLQTTSHSGTVASETQAYAELLQKEKARVESELRCPLGILHSGPMPIEDQVPVLHEQFLFIRSNNLAYEKIKAIEAAVERLNRGDYGICEYCDEPISEKRLKAVPWTPYCLPCQESFGDEKGFRVLHARAA